MSTIYVVTFYFGYIDAVEDSRPVNAGLSGLVINVVIAVSSEMIRRSLNSNGNAQESKIKDIGDYDDDEEGYHTTLLLFPECPNWDLPAISRFGDHALAPENIWRSMPGVPEPLTNIWWIALFFLTITLVTPLTPENEPPLIDGGSFLYPPAVIAGMPWWFLKLLMMGAISTLILLVAIYKTPNEYPKIRSDALVMKRKNTA